MIFFFLLLLAVGAAGAASGCSTNADCELLGTCTAGKCLCSKGFTGETCGRLDLLPADSTTANGKAWPKQPSGTGAAAWGMSVVRGDHDNYHAIVNVGCGETATKVTGTFAAILSSTEPDKNWTRASPARAQAQIAASIPAVQTGPASTCPWQASNVSITGCGNFHKSNPTTAFLKDGRVMLSYRFNYEGEMVAFATADDFRGPFTSIANLSHSHGNDEDSYFSDAFVLRYNTTGGDTIRVKRRERPEMLFGLDGHPQYFFSAVETEDGNSFSLVQPFA
eukprot:gene8220-27493_t